MKRKKKVNKEPIDPTRIRQIPREGFSWIERRFIRDRFIDRLPAEAILLYFFLAAVSDADGLSFYADPTIGKLLKLDPEQLTQARSRLISAKLILFEYPLYQVLPLPQEPSQAERPAFKARGTTWRGGDPASVSELLKLAITRARGSDRETREET